MSPDHTAIIAAANAALRLGDLFVPPKGTVVRCAHEYLCPDINVLQRWVIFGSSADGVEIVVVPIHIWQDPASRYSARERRWFNVAAITELIDFDRVECEILPFECWLRPMTDAEIAEAVGEAMRSGGLVQVVKRPGRQ